MGSWILQGMGQKSVSYSECTAGTHAGVSDQEGKLLAEKREDYTDVLKNYLKVMFYL